MRTFEPSGCAITRRLAGLPQRADGRLVRSCRCLRPAARRRRSVTLSTSRRRRSTSAYKRSIGPAEHVGRRTSRVEAAHLHQPLALVFGEAVVAGGKRRAEHLCQIGHAPARERRLELGVLEHRLRAADISEPVIGGSASGRSVTETRRRWCHVHHHFVGRAAGVIACTPRLAVPAIGRRLPRQHLGLGWFVQRHQRGRRPVASRASASRHFADRRESRPVVKGSSGCVRRHARSRARSDGSLGGRRRLTRRQRRSHRARRSAQLALVMRQSSRAAAAGRARACAACAGPRRPSCPGTTGSSLTVSARDIARPDLPANGRRLVVEVVQHLDVIAHEADRAQHSGLQARRAGVTKVVADVGPEPRVLGPPAAALVHQGVVRHTRGLRHEPRRLGQLLAVARPLGHGTSECCAR